jgi:hypothetical protein
MGFFCNPCARRSIDRSPELQTDLDFWIQNYNASLKTTTRSLTPHAPPGGKLIAQSEAITYRGMHDSTHVGQPL